MYADASRANIRAYRRHSKWNDFRDALVSTVNKFILERVRDREEERE